MEKNNKKDNQGKDEEKANAASSASVDTPNSNAHVVPDSENSNIIEEKPSKGVIETLRENPWILATIVLSVILLVFLVANFTGMTGNIISENKVEEIFLKAIESQGADVEKVEIKNISFESGMYKISFDYEGKAYPLPFYLSGDGSLLGTMNPTSTNGTQSETAEPEPVEVPKSEKPVVELFVMSYCPYGTQAEKGIIPVVELLGNKIDFRMRYVSYLMHGEKEAEENLREYCIQEIAPEKYLSYMRCFLEGDGVESNGYIANGNDVTKCLNEAKIDKTKLEKCISETDKEFSITENLKAEGNYPRFNVDAELNEKYGVQGSPSLVINGVMVNSARSPSAYLSAICQAFNTAPEECETELSSETPSPYFGWNNSGDSTAAQCS